MLGVVVVVGPLKLRCIPAAGAGWTDMDMDDLGSSDARRAPASASDVFPAGLATRVDVARVSRLLTSRPDETEACRDGADAGDGTGIMDTATVESRSSGGRLVTGRRTAVSASVMTESPEPPPIERFDVGKRARGAFVVGFGEERPQAVLELVPAWKRGGSAGRRRRSSTGKRTLCFPPP